MVVVWGSWIQARPVYRRPCLEQPVMQCFEFVFIATAPHPMVTSLEKHGARPPGTNPPEV